MCVREKGKMERHTKCVSVEPAAIQQEGIEYKPRFRWLIWCRISFFKWNISIEISIIYSIMHSSKYNEIIKSISLYLIAATRQNIFAKIVLMCLKYRQGKFFYFLLHLAKRFGFLSVRKLSILFSRFLNSKVICKLQ